MALGWIAPIVLVGVCVLSLLWTLVTAPGFKVRGLHVLLTGATHGLGLAIAKKYAREGAKLTLVGDSKEALDLARLAILKDAKVDEDAVLVAEADATDVEQMQRAVDAANAFHGRVTDHLVHAARSSSPGVAWEQEVATLRRHMDVNYMTAVVLLKTAVPAMVEKQVRGRVVLVSDVESLASAAGASSYSGSKSAVRGLADAMRNELKLYKISVSMFYPGSFRFNLLNDVSSTHVEPSTPVPGDVVATGYATFDETTSAAAEKQFDREVQTLVNGLWAGQYSITTTWNGFLLRMLANGVAPRNNSPLELMLLFFVSLGEAIANSFRDKAILASARPSAGASV